MSQVELDQAEKRLAELVERATHGEDIIITKSNQPLVKLVALAHKRRRRPGSAKGLIHMGDDFDDPLEDFQEYM